MKDEIYKVFQLMEFFVTKYSYSCFVINGLSKNNEIIVVSKENPSFNMIRISTDSVENIYYDEQRVEKASEIIKKRLGLEKISVLDIHISNEKLYGDEKFDTACLNTNFASGYDLKSLYPGVYEVVHDVSDGEADIKRSLFSINSKFSDLKEKAKKRPLSFKKVKEEGYLVTFVVMLICILMYILSIFLSKKYSSSVALILLGADYKMFTLGLGQFFRLITCAFIHGSLIHILCNLLSFYMIGKVVEKTISSLKYLLMLFVGILFSSLCRGILTGNSLSIGLSGGIYTIFIYMVLYSINSGYISLNTFMPTLILNLALNFMPGVSWQCHLGGAFAGVMFYYLYKDKKINLNILALIVVLTITMFTKYIKDFNLKPYYSGTDLEVIDVYRDIGLNNYSDKALKKLYKIYMED